MSGKSDSNIQSRLSTLKQKQDKWMKERNIALTANQHKSSPRTSTTSTNKLNAPNTQKTPGNNSVKKKTSETLSWTNSPGGSTAEFVVRRNSGRLTNRSTTSTKSSKNTPLTANSNKNVIKSSKLENTDRRKTSIKDDSASYNDDSISSEDESVDLSAKINKYLSTTEIHGQSIKNDIYNVNSIPNQRTSSPKTLSSHLCALCQNHMLSTQHAPHLVIPCAHSFCYSCVNQEKYCPTCRVNIMSVQKNVALHEIIKQYEKQKQVQLEERRKVEIKKYFDEYNSIETRVDLMKVEAAEIIDSMEDITNELINERNAITGIEDTASSIKQQINSLQDRLKTLENEHRLKNEQCNQLEDEYAKKKKQLLLTEKTLKTLQDSKDRIKILIQSLYPSYEFEEDES